MKTLAVILAAFCALAVSGQPALPEPPGGVVRGARGAIPLSWQANVESDLYGYYVLYGSSTTNYTNSIWVGNRTNFNAGINATGLVFLAVTAVNKSGLESDPSNEVSAVANTNRPSATKGLSTVVVVNGLLSSRYPKGPWVPVEAARIQVIADDNARFFKQELNINKGPDVVKIP